MIYYLTKIAITTALIVAISEVARRSSFAAAILASIPLVSVLAILWLYFSTKDVEKVSALATNIFWFVLPSLVLFVSLPMMLNQGVNFYLSISISIGFTIATYLCMAVVLNHFGVKL